MDLLANNGGGRVTWWVSHTMRGSSGEGTEAMDPRLLWNIGNHNSVIGRLESGYCDITVTAMDDEGNQDSLSFTVTVEPNYSGIFGDTVTPDMSILSSVDMTPELRNRLASSLRIEDGTQIYSLFDEPGVTVNSLTRTLTYAEQAYLYKEGERILFALPEVTVSKPGYYAYRVSLRNYVTEGAVCQRYHYPRDSALVPFVRKGNGDPLDWGREGSYYVVPEDQMVMWLDYMEAEKTHWAIAVTLDNATDPLPVLKMEPSPDISIDRRSWIAKTLSADIDKLYGVTYEHLTSPKEPTKKVADRIKDDSYGIVGKLDTATADRDGHYLFRITLPDELVGIDINLLRLYAMTSGDLASGDSAGKKGTAVAALIASADVASSDVTSSDVASADVVSPDLPVPSIPLNPERSFFGDGAQLDLKKTEKTLIAVLPMSAGKPISVYLARMVQASHTGSSGCDAGFTFGAGLFAAAGLLALKLARKRR